MYRIILQRTHSTFPNSTPISPRTRAMWKFYEISTRKRLIVRRFRLLVERVCDIVLRINAFVVQWIEQPRPKG